MLKLPAEIECNTTEMAVATPPATLRVTFSRYSPNSPVFELTGLKGDLDQDGYLATKAGTLLTITLKKLTKEKWNTLTEDDGPSLVAEKVPKSPGGGAYEVGKSMALSMSMMEPEGPRDFAALVSLRGVHAASRPSDLLYQSVVSSAAEQRVDRGRGGEHAGVQRNQRVGGPKRGV